ncbi:pectinesterase inhibitor 9-like [Dioscorea cayenensis subsp. rotundata]|uniref:Pectinesterase inhibitor 9-like n=1 Tax=Dioscorea cayennensis subsp. rotundata TaxID=55577 RepID=A0AB40D6M5_DIOCR|nr:pectinesterase inhibitor 9-like [Dioscorea cayenensis subsp. rotundata]
MALKSPQIPILFFVSALTFVAGDLPVIPPTTSVDNSTAFIRSSCGATRYPELCFSSLIHYADTVRSDPVLLAWLAVNITLGRVRSVSSHISSLRQATTSGDSREFAALRDCAETLADAAQLAKKSASEIGRLAKAETSPEVGWWVSNAQTWLSAVLTNEDTCTDGFSPVGASTLKADVCRRVGSAKKYTSNALALVNKLVSSR